MEDDLKNFSQQLLARSLPIFKLILRGPNQNRYRSKMKTTSMEDDLKNLKIDFLSNHWADIYQYLNLTSGDQNR
jgi:hypothetical protein